MLTLTPDQLHAPINENTIGKAMPCAMPDHLDLGHVAIAVVTRIVEKINGDSPYLGLESMFGNQAAATWLFIDRGVTSDEIIACNITDDQDIDLDMRTRIILAERLTCGEITLASEVSDHLGNLLLDACVRSIGQLVRQVLLDLTGHDPFATDGDDWITTNVTVKTSGWPVWATAPTGDAELDAERALMLTNPQFLELRELARDLNEATGENPEYARGQFELASDLLGLREPEGPFCDAEAWALFWGGKTSQEEINSYAGPDIRVGV